MTQSHLRKKDGKIVLPEKMIVILDEAGVDLHKLRQIQSLIRKELGIKRVYFHYTETK